MRKTGSYYDPRPGICRRRDSMDASNGVGNKYLKCCMIVNYLKIMTVYEENIRYIYNVYEDEAGQFKLPMYYIY